MDAPLTDYAPSWALLRRIPVRGKNGSVMTSAPVDPITPASELPAPARLSDVTGWFFPADQVLFEWFLTRQRERMQPGDLLEIGVYLGKSAIFTGTHRRADERFTVCDLFDSPAGDTANTAEMDRSYSTLTRRAFEANYLSFHDRLPTVVQGPSSLVPDRVDRASCRFVHIDASHLYEHVHADIENVRDLLTPHGVVVLDDFRAEHCPGVAAATWQAVTSGGLRAVCITGTKFYGTWGDPQPLREALLAWLETRDDMWHEVQVVVGEPLIRIDGRKAVAPAQPTSRYAATVPAQHVPEHSTPAPAPAAPRTVRPAAPAGRRRSPLRRFAVSVLPPFITRAIVAAQRHR